MRADRNIRTLTILALVLIAYPVTGKEQFLRSINWLEVPVASDKIVSQKPNSVDCGYAAILNSLGNGSAASQNAAKLLGQNPSSQIKYLAEKYGSKRSDQDGIGPRQKEDGIKPNDLRDAFNEIRLAHGLPRLAGNYLERQEGETQKQLLTRIHAVLYRSLKSNEPPIILVRSHVASWQPKFFEFLHDLLSGTNPMEKECIWTEISGHYVTIIGLPELVNEDGSFPLKYLDSLTGKEEQLFVHSDARDYLGYQYGRLGRTWSKGSQFACATGSALDLNTSKQTWSSRSEIFLVYAIYKN